MFHWFVFIDVVVVVNEDACFYESFYECLRSFAHHLLESCIIPDVLPLIPHDCATTCSDRQLNNFETLQEE